MTHTINTGIGVFTANCLENLKLKMFLDSLKDQIEINGKLDEIIAFVDGSCDEGNQALKDRVYELEEEIKDKEYKIEELESEIEDLEEQGDTQYEIETGLGKLEYNVDNLAIKYLMENLEEACRKTSTLKVSQLLESIN